MDVKTQDVICLAQFLFPGETERKVVADILQTVSGAVGICRVKYLEGETSQDVCMQIHKDKIVVTGILEEDPFGYELKEPSEMKRACYYLFNCFEYAETRMVSVPALFLSRSRYEEIKQQAGSCSLCMLAEYLGEETGDLASSTELAKVMLGPEMTGELRLCSRTGSGWSLQQASYFENAAGGWLLRMSSEPTRDYLIAAPLTKAELCCAFYEWVMHSTPIFTPE
ncbi:hypothetical protein R50912_19160 [Paenibacillus sp. FSL R5-0912]|nr:hypothetical protein R50912_19160 [Paenibacillus sp. FSL R5-0912]